jgi:transcriptional regulator with GAF, ATPase, and Fis domain
VNCSATLGVHSRAAIFQLADGALILLDEVGEMPYALQAKLLRFLQSGEIRPVGENEPHKVNARAVASTNKDLAGEVEKGTFIGKLRKTPSSEE